MKRRLFTDEHELQSWSSLTLTTHRIIQHISQHGFDASTSILLDHVQWTRISRVHKPLLPIVGGGLLVLGAIASFEERGSAAPVLFVAAIVVLVIYQATRRATMTVASGSGRIELALQPTEHSRQLARDFLDAVESAASLAGSRSGLAKATGPRNTGPTSQGGRHPLGA